MNSILVILIILLCSRCTQGSTNENTTSFETNKIKNAPAEAPDYLEKVHTGSLSSKKQITIPMI